MENIQLILITCVVSFGLTIAQRPNLTADQAITDGVYDNGSRIRGNFQNSYVPIPMKDDMKKGEIHHEILIQKVAREQLAFDAMKEELWIVRNKNVYKKRNSYGRNNAGKFPVATKRETIGKNLDIESQAENGNPKFKNVLKNSPESSEPTLQSHQDSIQDRSRRVGLGTIGQEFSNSHQNQSSLLAKYNWNVTDVLGGVFSVMMLNIPIASPKFATFIWRRANFKILIDGGGNRLYDLLFNASRENCSHDLPHVVSGDFDSICPNVLNFFKKLNVKVVHTPDQEETDFFKGLKVLAENTNDRNVIVYCDTVGRLDHIMENLNTLFMCSSHETLGQYNIFLLNHKSLTWLLRPGFHVIHIPPYLWTDKSYCGLIPVGRPCHHVTTKGLNYNLRDGEIQFGKTVSTSNGYDMDSGQREVHISTDSEMIWTMTIDERMCTDT